MASKTARAATSATEALKILWEENFFVGWKKVGPIEDVLAKRGNHFSDAELGMALKRAKHLTRKGKRRNYEYIQKYPYAVAAQQDEVRDGKPRARKR
jgi:hypothetical protein